MRGAPQSGFSTLIRRISAQISVDLGSSPPTGAISNAGSGESQPDADAQASRAGRS
jgi:hypothetical protein